MNQAVNFCPAVHVLFCRGLICGQTSPSLHRSGIAVLRVAQAPLRLSPRTLLASTGLSYWHTAKEGGWRHGNGAAAYQGNPPLQARPEEHVELGCATRGVLRRGESTPAARPGGGSVNVDRDGEAASKGTQRPVSGPSHSRRLLSLALLQQEKMRAEFEQHTSLVSNNNTRQTLHPALLPPQDCCFATWEGMLTSTGCHADRANLADRPNSNRTGTGAGRGATAREPAP